MNLASVNRVNQLDWLKAFAIIMVLITHTLQSLNIYSDALIIGRPFWIDMAVPIFMIISGFTFSMSAEKNNISSWKIGI